MDPFAFKALTRQNICGGRKLVPEMKKDRDEMRVEYAIMRDYMLVLDIKSSG